MAAASRGRASRKLLIGLLGVQAGCWNWSFPEQRLVPTDATVDATLSGSQDSKTVLMHLSGRDASMADRSVVGRADVGPVEAGGGPDAGVVDTGGAADAGAVDAGGGPVTGSPDAVALEDVRIRDMGPPDVVWVPDVGVADVQPDSSPGLVVVRCSGGPCTCPAGSDCLLDCRGLACGDQLRCGDAARCRVWCDGHGCTNKIYCGSGPCTIECLEESCHDEIYCHAGAPCSISCAGSSCRDAIHCNGACACDVSCEGQACGGDIECIHSSCKTGNSGCTTERQHCNSCQ